MLFPGVGEVPIRWYLAPDQSKALDKPTVYCSRNWQDDDLWKPGTPGEVKGAPRPWRNGSGPNPHCKVFGSADAWMGKPGPLTNCEGFVGAAGGGRVGGSAIYSFGNFFVAEGGTSANGTGDQGEGFVGTGGMAADGSGTFGVGWEASGGVSADGVGAQGEGFVGAGGGELNGAGAFLQGFYGIGGGELNGEGDFDTGGGDDMPVGAICFWPNTTPPTGWLVCDGSTVSQSTYPDLYTLCGTTFGPATGGNFTLPDLRSRAPIGNGQGSGLSSRTLGATGGEENHTLTTSEIPSHSHTQASGTAVTSSSGTIPAGTSLMTTWLSGGTTATAGGGGSHNTMPPWLALVPIIRAL